MLNQWICLKNICLSIIINFHLSSCTYNLKTAGRRAFIMNNFFVKNLMLYKSCTYINFSQKKIFENIFSDLSQYFSQYHWSRDKK